MIVNMNQLRSFYTAAKLHSVAKAAQALMVTPPAITQHIKRFEDSIGIRLIVREAHSIRLTSTGEGVMQRAEKIFEEIHDMEGYLEDISAGKSGDLRVGCPEAPLKNLAPLIETFRKTYPGVKIILDQGSNAEMVKSIVDHRNELAVVRYSPSNSRLKTKALWREEIVLIATPQSMHFTGSELSVMQLSQIPLILRREGSAVREVVLEYLRRFKVTPNVSVESASTAGLKDFVRQDAGIGFIERGAVQEELKNGALRTIQIVEETPLIEFGIAYANRRELSPAAWAFLRLIDTSWALKS
jgi:DNA-binding transcriptional LysR family regulator